MGMMMHRNRVRAREMAQAVSQATPVAEEKKTVEAPVKEEPTKKTVKRGRRKAQ